MIGRFQSCRENSISATAFSRGLQQLHHIIVFEIEALREMLEMLSTEVVRGMMLMLSLRYMHGCVQVDLTSLKHSIHRQHMSRVSRATKSQLQQ